MKTKDGKNPSVERTLLSAELPFNPPTFPLKIQIESGGGLLDNMRASGQIVLHASLTSALSGRGFT